MTEIEILRKADQIIRARMNLPMTDIEREYFQNAVTGLLWIRTDIVIEEAATLGLVLPGRHQVQA